MDDPLPMPLDDLLGVQADAVDEAALAGLSPIEALRMRRLLSEKAQRRVDSLRLYEPLPMQAAYHVSEARIRLIRGSNRSGKSLSAACEVARCVTGQDPHRKYPETGYCYAVGKDHRHIGLTMWPLLGKPGAFKMIRDRKTRAWRAFHPWEEADLLRADEARPAPPLIASRMIDDIAWEDKKAGIPSRVILKTGWEIVFFSSLGKPPQGCKVDLWWFDEEIVDPEWFPEIAARTLDRKGRGCWSATPQAGTEHLYDLHERAEAQRFHPKPDVEEFVSLLERNPHIGEQEKQQLAEDLDDEQRRVRIGGEFALVSYRVYPEFLMALHGIDLDRVPMDWTRYMVVDPGHQLCAVLFAAIPPDESQCVIYDELFLRDCDAAMFASAVSGKTKGEPIQAAVIDPHGAILSDLGSGRTVALQYSEALEKVGFYAAATGTRFIMGGDDIAAGLLAVHGWLRPQASGQPYLRIRRGHCQNLEDEFKRYVKLRVDGKTSDKPNQRRHSHGMDALRYLALYDPPYQKPRRVKAPLSGAIKALRAKRDRSREKNGPGSVNLGQGSLLLQMTR